MGFVKGDLVVDPTDPARTAVVVGGPKSVGGADFYVLLLSSQEQGIYAESDLVAKASDPDNPVSWLTDRPLLDPDGLARVMTQLKLSSGLTDVVYSLSSSRTVFRVHQFKPVLKVIDSPVHRLLLADEVGLGKTIEAGLVWTELDARSPIRRTLVLCPNNLQRKWQREMENRFDRPMEITNRAGFLRLIERYHERGDATTFSVISSPSQLRDDKVLERLSETPPMFDLVIVDEAHSMRNTSTKTHRLGELLAHNSEALLLLSATPVNLGSNDLFNLLELLRPEEFNDPELFRYQLEPNEWINAAAAELRRVPPDIGDAVGLLRRVEKTSQGPRFLRDPRYMGLLDRLDDPRRIFSRGELVELQAEVAELNTLAHVYTRTRKRDLPDQPTLRRARHLEVEFNHVEQAIHDATLRLVAELKRYSAGGSPALAAVMPARQASSCLPAMKAYLDRLVVDRHVELVGEDGDDEDDEIFDGVDRSEVGLRADAAATIRHITDLWEQLGDVDSKYEYLADCLRDLREAGSTKTLLFAFFRGTLEHLADRLTRDGYRVLLLHGGVPMRDRDAILEQFRHEPVDVLLCSEIGSEGLDFEFCDVIVNYDLPWNPMRLEQRIGRLDRFGQQSPVIHVINFKLPGTIDTEIFWRLYDRLGVFERSIGELEPILGDQFREVTRAMASPDLTFEEQRHVAESVAQAIEREQKQLESFEEDRRRLVGSDAFIEQSLGDAYRAKRYLTPEELSRYVEGFLREEASPAHLDGPVTSGAPWSLVGSHALVDELRTNAANLITPAFGSLLGSLEAGGSVLCSFDSAHAESNDTEFLTLRHPFIRALSAIYSQAGRALHPAGYVTVPSDVHTGQWIFFAVLLSATGLLPRRSLFAVACRRGTAEVDEEVGESVLTYLAGPDPERLQQRHIPIVEPSEVETAYNAVLDLIAARRALLHEQLQERNDATINAQQESLRLSVEVRRSRIRDLADRPGLHENIRRMRLSQISNIELDAARKIDKLEKSRHVSVGFKIVAGGLARFT